MNSIYRIFIRSFFHSPQIYNSNIVCYVLVVGSFAPSWNCRRRRRFSLVSKNMCGGNNSCTVRYTHTIRIQIEEHTAQSKLTKRWENSQDAYADAQVQTMWQSFANSSSTYYELCVAINAPKSVCRKMKIKISGSRDILTGNISPSRTKTFPIHTSDELMKVLKIRNNAIVYHINYLSLLLPILGQQHLKLVFGRK